MPNRPRKPPFPEPQLIADTAALAAFCAPLHAEPFITVDTEFMLERTYFP